MRNPFKRPQHSEAPLPDLHTIVAAHLAIQRERARAAGVWAPDHAGEIVAWHRWPGAHWRTWRVDRKAGPDNGITATRDIDTGTHADLIHDRNDLIQEIADIRALPGTDPLGMDQR